MRSIYESTGGTTFTTEKLISKIKAYTGKDLRGFAKDWIFSSKTLDYAILDVKRSNAGSGHTTFITVKNQGTGTMPADLVVYDTEGKLLDHRRIEVGPELARDFEFETKKEVTRVSIDEGEYVPDLNRRNNFFPREGFGFGFVFDNYSTDRYSLTLDIYLAMKQALEVRGGYLDDHRWSLLAGQRFYDKDTHFWIGRGSFSKNVGRNKYVYSRVSYNAWQKDLSRYYWGVELGIMLPFFSSINIGYTGRYNVPANTVGLHVSYLNYRNIIDSVDDDFDDSEIHKEEAIIGLAYSRNDMLKLGWKNRFTGSYFAQSRNYKLKLSSEKYFKLTGRILFSIFGEYGYASEEIPALYMFDLDHMNIFEYRIIGPALVHMKLNSMIKLFKIRKTRIFGRAEKFIPVLNFLVFEGVNAGAFFQASDVYSPQYAKKRLN